MTLQKEFHMNRIAKLQVSVLTLMFCRPFSSIYTNEAVTVANIYINYKCSTLSCATLYTYISTL